MGGVVTVRLSPEWLVAGAIAVEVMGMAPLHRVLFRSRSRVQTERRYSPLRRCVVD